MICWPIHVNPNKYSRWYENLIEKAKSRGTVLGYKETHHIIPMSLLGTNSKDNLVELTAREHYVAHLLLWKMDMLPKWHNKMSMALHVMVNGSGNKNQHRTYLISSRLYELTRKSFVAAMKAHFAEHGGTMKGKKHKSAAIEKMKAWQAVPEIKQQQRERVLGEKNPMYGKTHSEEMKKQISESVAKSWSEEDKQAKSEWAKKKWEDPAYRQSMLDVKKTSPAWINRDWSTINKKAAATRMARGWKPSEETKQKQSASRRAKIAKGELVAWNKGKKLDHLSGENSPTARAWVITEVNGKTYSGKGRHRLKELCTELDIGYWSMLELLNGKKGKNKLFLDGWQAAYS